MSGPGGSLAIGPRAAWRRLTLLAIAVAVGGWLLFDGARALVVGHYVTPSSGAYAGQLGPWARLVEAVGLDPRSTLVRGLHVLCGALWIAAAGAVLRRRGARAAVVVAAVASLWYLPFGTLGGLVALGLVLTRSGTAAESA